MDWIGLDGLDLSQNITPPRAPCGANKCFHLFPAIDVTVDTTAVHKLKVEHCHAYFTIDLSTVIVVKISLES